MKDKSFAPISSEEHLVTPERLAKGDLHVQYNAKGFIKAALPTDRYVVKRLVKNGLLEYHHEIYGVGFLELRAAFRAPWATRISAVLLEQFGVGVSLSRATEIYQNVCRGLRGRGIEILEYALELENARQDKYSVGLYQEHFERLVQLMDEERERIYREQQAVIEQQINKF